MNQNRFFIGLTVIVAAFALIIKLHGNGLSESDQLVVSTEPTEAAVVGEETLVTNDVLEQLATTTEEVNVAVQESETDKVPEPSVAAAAISEPAPAPAAEPALPTFTKKTLSRYDGTDPELPIYLALEGKVYDVTAGAEFYEPGGPYDYLAGTDGTTLLKLFGGDLIKEKYPVIGVYQK